MAKKSAAQEVQSLVAKLKDRAATVASGFVKSVNKPIPQTVYPKGPGLAQQTYNAVKPQVQNFVQKQVTNPKGFFNPSSNLKSIAGQDFNPDWNKLQPRQQVGYAVSNAMGAAPPLGGMLKVAPSLRGFVAGLGTGAGLETLVQDKPTLKSTVLSPTTLISGVLGGTYGGGAVKKLDDLQYGKNRTLQEAPLYSGINAQKAKLPSKGLFEVIKYKNGQVIQTRTFDSSLQAKKAMKMIPLEKGESLGVRDITSTTQEAQSEFRIAPERQTTKTSTDDYLKELIGRQKSAKGPSGPTGVIQKGKNLLAEIKEKFVDTNSPIEDAISYAEKKGKFKVLPKNDPRLQIDRVLRSKTLASQFADDNGLTNVIRQAPDIDALDQYMIAKQARTIASSGRKTGRDLAKDEQLINDLSGTYEPLAKQVTDYSRKVLQYSVDSGLVSKELAQKLIKEYPDYVPLNRVFSELERGTLPTVGRRGVASLSRQSVVQKLKGSEREISSPIESLLLKTQDAFNQGERNKTAKMLGQMKDLPEMKGIIRELKSGENATHTFSYLDNGVKRTFETTPEIAAAAKSLNVEQMGLIAKIFSVPTRVLQLGATGLNVPFVVTNLIKDQMTLFINSNKAAKVSLLNPVNFGKALFSAVKHDKLYDELIRNAGGGTTFDIAREAPNLSVQRLRAGRNTASKILYTVKNPGELLRAVENLVGRAEEVGRLQSFRGTREALLKEGRTTQDASLLGAQAARENTANFARKGSWGRVLNYVIPFFNAGIQGARQLNRSFQNNPKGTSAKVAIGLFMPVAAATAWNTSDPQRKQIYDDIDTFEKENNLIIIPDGATKDEKGRWNIIKIPIPPGLSNLASVVRRPLEQAAGLDPVKLGEIAANLFTAGTSLDVTSPNKLISTFTPQAIKPAIESYTNTSLFTGKPIVPQSMQDLPPENQARPYTSGTARAIGGALNASPLKVENFVRTAAGGVGSQALNISDRILASSGAIPPEQIGGEDPFANIQRRFTKASGGRQEEKQYQEIQKYKQADALRVQQNKQAMDSLIKQMEGNTPEEKKQLILSIPDKKFQKDLVARMIDEKLGLTPAERSLRGVTIKQRASYVKTQLKGKTKEEKKQLILEYAKKKILTKEVFKEMMRAQ